MNCLICKNRKADKKGSHIIPQLLLKSMVNKRDNEQSFKYQNLGSNYYFGRSVLPKYIEKTLGREITDIDIKENENHYTLDNVFCKSCEKNLSYLETLYTQKVIPSIDNEVELDSIQKKISYFFWLSVLLRCSITDFTNFKFDAPTEKKLRESIDNLLDDSVEKIEEKILKQSIDYNIFIYSNRTSEDKTRNCILLHPEKQYPSLVVINEFVVVFDFTTETDVRKLENELSISLYKKTDSKVITGFFSEPERENLIQYCNQIKARQLIQFALSNLKKEYEHNNKQEISPQSIEDFLKDLIEDDSIDSSEKYSQNRIKKLIDLYSSKN